MRFYNYDVNTIFILDIFVVFLWFNDGKGKEESSLNLNVNKIK